jgi:hypothetical protein
LVWIAVFSCGSCNFSNAPIASNSSKLHHSHLINLYISLVRSGFRVSYAHLFCLPHFSINSAILIKFIKPFSVSASKDSFGFCSSLALFMFSALNQSDSIFGLLCALKLLSVCILLSAFENLALFISIAKIALS